MAGRVNTKFVLLLGTAIALAVVGLFGVWYLYLSRNPEQLARQGDLFLQEGDFKSASESYAKASSRDRSSIEYLDKFFDATNRWPVNDRTEADRNLQRLMQAKRMKVEARPGDEAFLQEHYQYLGDLAKQLSAPLLYRRIHGDASIKLDAVADSVVARKYRGLSQVHLMTDRGDTFDIPREDQLLAGDDLYQVLEQTPNDTQVLNQLARWTLFDARYIRSNNGKKEDIQSRRSDAVSLSRRMLEIDPDDLDLRLDHILILLQTLEGYQQDVPAADEQVTDPLHEEAATLMGEVEAALLDQPSPVLRVLEAARLLTTVDREPVTLEGTNVKATAGFLRAVQLLYVAVEKNPTTVDYLFVLGNDLLRMGETDQATTLLKQVMETDMYAPAIQFIRNHNYRFQAEIKIANLLIVQRAKTDDLDEIAAIDQQIRDSIKNVETNLGRTPAIDMLEGKFMMALGEYARGQQLLNKASSETGETDAQAMILAAEASRRTGDWGEAARQYNVMLAQQPGRIGWRIQLAQIYLQGQRFDDAERQIEILEQLAGDHPMVTVLQASLLVGQNRVEEAITLFESLDRTDNLPLDLQLAKLYVLQGRADDAIAILQSRFNDNPADSTVLQMLIRLTDDLPQQQAYLAQARQANVDEKLLSLIELQIGDNPATPEELRQHLLDLQDDPFANAMLRVSQARQAGDLDLAVSALAEAATHRPDDPNVIRLQFDLAISREQWGKAGQIADQAGQKNLDLADGVFYQGDLAVAQGHWEEAIAEYEKGLNVRPIYSEGWRRLADARVKMNRPQQAMEAYRHALDQQPNNVRALSNLSMTEGKMGLFTAARQHAEQAWRYQPNNMFLFEHYLRMEQAYGDPKVALDMRQKLAVAQPNNSHNQRTLAMLLAQLERYDESLTQIQQVIEREGATATNVTTLAALLREMGQVEEGEQVLNDYINDQGNEVTGADYVRLGQYRLQTGQTDQAIKAYTQACQYDDPETKQYTRVLADLLFELNRTDDAIVYYRDLHQNAPDDPAIALRFAEVMMRTEKYDQADRLIASLQVPEEYQSTLYLLRSIMALPRSADEPADEIRAKQAKALQLIETSLQRDPENDSAYLHRAKLLINEPGQESKVIADLNRVLEINPQLRAPRFLLVQLYLRQDNRVDAIRELQQMLRQAADNRSARLALIELYTTVNNFSSAMTLINEAMALQPNDPVWLAAKIRLLKLVGQNRDVLGLLARLNTLNPSPQVLAEYALALLKAGQAEQVLSLFRERAEEVNKMPALEAIRAHALAKTGQLEEARRLFALTIEKATTFQTLSSTVRQMGLAVGAKDAKAWLLAIESVQESAWIEISIASIDMQGRRYSEAVSRLQAIENNLPSDPSTEQAYRRLLAISCYQAGQYEDAREAYEKVLALTPNDAGTMNNLAYLLIEDLHQIDAGLALAEQAAEAHPENAQILDTLGWGQYKAGQYDNARKTLEKSVFQIPLAPNSLHLAQVYLKLDQPLRAVDLLEQTLKIARKSNQAIYIEQAEALLETLEQSAP